MSSFSIHRYKIIIEYLGDGFCGWQRQLSGISVQEVIEDAIYQFTKEKIVLFAAGRTDSGVHALGQVAHFDLISGRYTELEIIGAINHFVRPHKIAIMSCKLTDEKFHARFSATRRHYLYKIINRPSKTIIEENRAWWVIEPLNINQMQLAADYLIGLHDFNAFRTKHCQSKSSIKTLSKIEIIKHNEEIRFYLSAPSFLHHMVRNIIGTLKLVGNNKHEPTWVKEVLKSKERGNAGPTAPAHGLYFLRADYE